MAADLGVTEYEIACDYESSLHELTTNSKPHINMLTMLAEENQRYARKIVEIIENRLQKVSSHYKLPILYLMDSIIKNCKKTSYRDEFAKNMPSVLADVYRTGDEKTRIALRKLRYTWSSVFSPAQLNALDVRMHASDPCWKIQAPSAAKDQKPIALSAEDIYIISTSVVQTKTKAEKAPPVNTTASDNKITAAISPPTSAVAKASNPPPAKVGHFVNSMVPVEPENRNKDDKDPVRFSLQRKQQLDQDLQEAQAELAVQRKQFEEALRLAAFCPPPPPPEPPTPTPQPQLFTPISHVENVRQNGNLSTRDDLRSQSVESNENFDSTNHQNNHVHFSQIASSIPVSSTIFTTPRNSIGEPSNDANVPAPSPSPIIYDSGKSQLDTVPSNNKIFVDGRPYEVRFIGESAVIERSGLPHLVSFVGKPKDVVIDGIPYRLSFGGESKEIIIDGRVHKIKFGAPSRELYIGSVPLRGAFGGPSIFAAINGVKHKIQLCGPPPEVKIDSEPSYELLRFMRSSHRAAGAPAYDYSSQAAALAAKSRTFNHVTSTNTAASMNQSPVLSSPIVPSPLAGLLSQLRLPTTVPSTATPVGFPTAFPSLSFSMDDTVIEKRQYPLSSLCEFNMNMFKIKYISIVEMLYGDKQIQCNICGLRFANEDKQKHSLHLNWHFRQTCKSETGCENCRNWFLHEQDWIEFSDEIDPNSKGQNKSRPKETDANPSSSADNVNDEPAPQEQNYCPVCGDKFEEFWDEEREAWTWHNSVVVDNKTYHTFCYQDAAASLITQTQDATMNGENETGAEDSCSYPLEKEIKTEPGVKTELDYDYDDDDYMDCGISLPLIGDFSSQH